MNTKYFWNIVQEFEDNSWYKEVNKAHKNLLMNASYILWHEFTKVYNTYFILFEPLKLLN